MIQINFYLIHLIYTLTVGEDYSFFCFDVGMTRKGKKEDRANPCSELEGYRVGYY